MSEQKPVRMLHVIPSADRQCGGPIEAVIQLCGALTVKGHEAEVVSLDSPSAPWLGDHPLRVHALGPPRGAYGYSSRLMPWLRANSSRYDVAVIHGIWQYHSFATRRALRSSGTPYVLYTHGMMDPWFKRQYPLKHIKKYLYWLGAERRVLRDADAVCFTCDEERLLARQSFAFYRCREAVVSLGTTLPTGDLAAQRSAFLGRYPQLAGRRLLLFLSRIHRKKGCDLLIEAFAAAARADPALHLVMAGPDQSGWQAGLARRAAALGVGGRVTWTGMLEGDLKWGAFHAAEAFVLPSHQENFGIAVTEALACGLPVLISDKVNIWREIVADRAGLVERDTLEGTVALLEGWAALSPPEKQTMRGNAQDSFATRFEIRQAADCLLEVLRRCQPA